MQQHFPISPCHPAPLIQKQVQTPIALLALCISQAAPVPLTSSLLYLPPEVCRFNVSTPAPSMHTCFQSTQALAVQHTTLPRLCRCQFVPTPFAACPPLRCSQPGWAAASVTGDARAHAKGWFQARGEQVHERFGCFGTEEQHRYEHRKLGSGSAQSSSNSSSTSSTSMLPASLAPSSSPPSSSPAASPAPSWA